MSGQCQCQEGAMGLKCNDCAFGFFGNHHQNIFVLHFLYTYIHSLYSNLNLVRANLSYFFLAHRHSSRLPAMPRVLLSVVRPHPGAQERGGHTGEPSSPPRDTQLQRLHSGEHRGRRAGVAGPAGSSQRHAAEHHAGEQLSAATARFTFRGLLEAVCIAQTSY